MSPIPTLLFSSEILLCFRKYDQVGSVFGNHIFSENMPWEAPFVKVGKGASSGDAVDGCGEETGQGRAGNLVGKILQQSLAKVPVKELEKTKPGKPVVKKVPKQKPRIDGPVFSQSPIQMKKVKLGGRRQKKTSNFMSEDEEDGGLGLDGRLEGGEEEDNLARSSSFFSFLQFLFFLFF